MPPPRVYFRKKYRSPNYAEVACHQQYLNISPRKPKKIPPNQRFAEEANLHTQDQYLELYSESIQDPDLFWLKQAKTLDWQQFPTKGCEYQWDTKNRIIEHRWFSDGILNVSANCLDRHLISHFKDKPAIIWQGDDDEEVRILTYKSLHEKCVALLML